MAWCHQAPSHYLNQCCSSSMKAYGITRLQWVKIGKLRNWTISTKSLWCCSIIVINAPVLRFTSNIIACWHITVPLFAICAEIITVISREHYYTSDYCHMSIMISQITSNFTVFSTACLGSYQRNHPSSALLAFCDRNPLKEQFIIPYWLW